MGGPPPTASICRSRREPLGQVCIQEVVRISLDVEMAEHALPLSELDEAQLIERARQNDCAAIRLIIKQQNRRLYRIARSIVRDDSEAEDALQEAYLRAFSNLDAFRGEARLGTWLARIVINEALTCLRRRRPAMDIDLLAERPADCEQSRAERSSDHRSQDIPGS